MINIAKPFENNNQSFINKPSPSSKSKAYALYIKIFQKYNASGSLVEGIVENWGKNGFLA